MKTAAGLRIAKSDSGSFVLFFLLFDRMSEPGQRSTCTIIEGESTLRVFWFAMFTTDIPWLEQPVDEHKRWTCCTGATTTGVLAEPA